MRKVILLLAMVIIMAIGSVDSMNWGNQCREAGGNCVVLRKASPACKKYRKVNDCRGTRSCCPEKFRIVGKDTSEEDSEKRPMKQRKKVGRKVQRPVTRQRCGTTDACSEKGGKCKKRCRKNSDPSLCDNNCVCCGICQAKPKCDSFEGVCRRSCSATERVIKGGCKKKKKCTCCAKQCEQNDCLGTCVSKKRECNGIFVKNGCGGKQCHCCNPVVQTPSPTPDTSTPAPGPSTPAPGPSTPVPNPSTPAPGPSTPAPGPSTPVPNPSTPAPGPSTPTPGPSTPAPGPSTPAPGPSTPTPGPSTPAPGPSTPAPNPSTSVPGPSTPAPDTSSPVPGTTAPDTVTTLPASTASPAQPCDYAAFTSQHSMLKDATCTNTKPAVTEAEKTEILNAHNTHRARVASGAETLGDPGPQPGGSNIRELKWNDELAQVAQAWMNQCTFAHDCSDCRKICSRDYAVGQNLYTFWTSELNENSIMWTEAIQSWYDEVKDMPASIVSSFGNAPSGKVIGHYTQVVWADSYEVGCGAVHFADSGTRKIYGCNYGPSGNFLTRPVYEQGPAASQCPNGVSAAYSDLCA